MDSAISLKKFLYCSLFFILFASNESFAQDTVMQKRNSIGIEVGHFLLEPSIYFQQDRGRWLYQLKVGYTPGNYEWGNGLNWNGYVVGGEIDFKLNKRKNFPYYAAGFYHSYVFIDSTVIADEMKAESYRYEGTYFGLRQALGYQWNFKYWNLSIAAGANLFHYNSATTNKQYLFLSPVLTPEDMSNETDNGWRVLPTLSFALGYRF